MDFVEGCEFLDYSIKKKLKDLQSVENINYSDNEKWELATSADTDTRTADEILKEVSMKFGNI